MSDADAAARVRLTAPPQGAMPVSSAGVCRRRSWNASS